MLVGKRISDRYKIIGLIGGGGMSNVYLAHDMILNRDVAIKILRYDFTNEDDLYRRFQREALSATSLTHPNIVSVYDVGDDGDLHYIVMEYVQGKTLKQYIQEFAPISPARCVHIMKQLTSAIANAHENHIIHRDIKPQNILMDAEGNVKITDFGIAMTLSATSFTQTNSVLGTVHYLSPEQARGGTATNKSDIYALGIVLYELLTGELPFSGESAVSIALKHLQSETPSVRAFDATIPQSVENVVLKATAKDASHRYSTVEELQADLETVLSPNRMNEPKFVIPVDNDVTKAIPIIKEPIVRQEEDLMQTRAIEPITQSKPKPEAKKPVEKTVPVKKKKKKKKKWPIVVAGLVIVAIAIFLFVFFATDLFSPKKMPVPSVANMTVEEATKKLEADGFTVGQSPQERYDEDIEKDKVIETDPSEGTERVKGTEVDLIVSLGVEMTKVEDYRGQQISQVQSVLKDKFLDSEVSYVNSKEPEGRIIEQEPAPQEEVVAKNTIMKFTVSAGVKMITVDDVVNYSKAQMDEYVRREGLTWRIVREENDDTIPAGNVKSQLTRAGTRVEAGTAIAVVLSKGPAAKPDKTLVLTVPIEYKPKEEGLEQTIRIDIQDKNHKMLTKVETFTITADQEHRIQLVIGDGQDAAYKIIRDSEIIAEETYNYDDVK